MGSIQTAVLLAQICAVEPSGIEACPGLGLIGGGAEGAPVCQGMGKGQPSEGRDSVLFGHSS